MKLAQTFFSTRTTGETWNLREIESHLFTPEPMFTLLYSTLTTRPKSGTGLVKFWGHVTTGSTFL
jgi:hypothetical protein